MILRDARTNEYPDATEGDDSWPTPSYMARKAPEDDEDFDGDFEDEGDDDDAAGVAAGLSEADKESAKPKTLTRKEAIEILQSSRSFVGLDLRKANLTKLDFSNCSFAMSNLSYVNFKDSNLEGCDFSNASLWNANLEGANLTRANLEDADLDYTKLRGAVLYRANIRRATLPTDLIPRDEILRSVNDGTKVAR
jgi:uncharacterized protein YjbI with pentapeptide repeats